jgi:hypothetical protein
MQDLIKEQDLQIGKDNAVAETPDPETLRKLVMEFLTRNNKGSQGSDVFSKGSAGFPAQKLKSIDYEKPRSAAKSSFRSTAKATNTAKRNTGAAATSAGDGTMEGTPTSRSGAIPPLRLKGPKVRSPIADADAQNSGPAAEQNSSHQKTDTTPALGVNSSEASIFKPAKVPAKRQSEEASQEQNVSKRARYGEEPAVTGSIEHATQKAATLFLPTSPTPAAAKNSAEKATQNVVFPAAPASPTLSTSKTRVTNVEQRPESAPLNQSVREQLTDGKEAADGIPTEPAAATRIFKPHPVDAQIIDDPENRMTQIVKLFQDAIHRITQHYGIDTKAPMFLPSADTSAFVEKLYSLAISRKGEGWAVAYSEHVLAKTPLRDFLAAVLCACTHEEIFAKPVPWQTPHQLLDGMKYWVKEISELAQFSYSYSKAFDGLVFGACANAIRLKSKLREEVIEPMAKQLAGRPLFLLRELFHAQIQAGAKGTVAEREAEKVAWTQATEDLREACEKALMLRGLWETTYVEMDVTWVQPGTRFNHKTMTAVRGWHPTMTGPFEVTMSLTPMVSSEPQGTFQKWNCWTNAQVYVKELAIEKA